jgi:AcrR family transcriptional regulator
MSTKNKNLDRRIQRTRQYLRNALIQLIQEKGFDAITIQDLTDRASLNRATFYLHYRDKYDLLEQSINEVIDELIAKIMPSEHSEAPHNPDEPFPGLVAFFEHVAENADFFRTMLGSKGIPEFSMRLINTLKTAFQQILEKVKKQGHQLRIPEEIILSYTTSAYLGVIRWWLENNMPYPPHFMAQQLTMISSRKS